MAQLPRYQSSGIFAADVPRLDFANLRESAQGMQNISGQLDRLSQFAFGEAKREQDKADKLTAIQVRSELEGVVQKRMAELTVLVETGQMADYGKIQSEIQSLSGLADGLKDLDIDQANGLLSSIRTSGKALMAKSSDIIVKNYQAGLKVQVNDLTTSLERTLQTAYEVSQDPTELEMVKGNARGKVFALSMQAGNADEAMIAFDKAATRARDSVLARYFTSKEFGATSTYDAVERIRRNEAGKYLAVWDGMPSDQKDAVIKQIYDEQARKAQVLQNEQSAKKNLALVNDTETWDAYYNGQIGGEEAIRRLKAGGGISPEQIKAIRSGDQGGANLALFGSLEMQARTGNMSIEQVDGMLANNQISAKQRNDLNKIVLGLEGKDMGPAKELISNAFVPNKLDPSTTNSHMVRARVESKLIVARDQAQKDGKPFDPIAEAQKLIDAEKNSIEITRQAEAKKTLEDRLKAAGLQKFVDNGIIPTEEDLINAGIKKSDPNFQPILRAARAMKAAK